MLYRLLYVFLIYLSYSFVCAGSASNFADVQVGILTDNAPASSISLSGEADGIGVRLFYDIIKDLPINIVPVYFHDRRVAIEAMKSNAIQVLLGSFEEDPELSPYNVTSTLPYLIDELSITSMKKNITLPEIMALVFNPMFRTVLFLSLFTGVIFTLILYFLEKDKHPHFKNCTNTEKISYCFFTIFSCFFRDLLYDPVTSLGRLLFSVWMIISVFTITILSALITSSVLFLMNTGSQTLYSIGDLRTYRVGILYGYPRLHMLLEKSGAEAVQYPDTTSLFQALRDHEIDYAAVGKTTLNKYYDLHRQHESKMTTSNILLGYETWSLYVNQYYGSIVFERPLVELINEKINLYRNNFHLFDVSLLILSKK